MFFARDRECQRNEVEKLGQRGKIIDDMNGSSWRSRIGFQTWPAALPLVVLAFLMSVTAAVIFGADATSVAGKTSLTTPTSGVSWGPWSASGPFDSAPPERTGQFYVGNPLTPLISPVRVDSPARFFTETGHMVEGEFLLYYRSVPEAALLFGLPLSEAFPQQFVDGRLHMVQYFERARLEWHPELAKPSVELGSLSAALLGGRSFAKVPSLPNTATRLYFPETGHTIANGFLSFWRSKGGVPIFGLPLSEEFEEKGVSVQYFERARLEYHKDIESTGYAVVLSPVGYEALKAGHFSIPSGSLVEFEPAQVAEGHTAEVSVRANSSDVVSGEYEGQPLYFRYDAARGSAWAVMGAIPFQDVGPHAVTLTVREGNSKTTVRRNLNVVPYQFPTESLQFDADTAALLDPVLTGKEKEILAQIFGARTQEQLWSGPFRMPLDGNIRITSVFATRRCYSCPPGGLPTTYHGGLDMAAREGSPVHAPAAGRVVYAGKLAVRGNAVIIDHGMGVFSLFAHNSKLVAQVGQTVQKGDVISLSGNTGLSNGPHLHWELHVSGPPVDPLEWVSRHIP